MVDGFHHAAVPVSDLPSAVDFYVEVLGLDLVGPDDPDETVDTADYVWLAVDDDEWINLAERPDATPDHPGEPDDPHLAFRASRAGVRVVRERLVARGADVRESRTSVYFHDPDGNFVEVSHWDGPETRDR